MTLRFVDHTQNAAVDSETKIEILEQGRAAVGEFSLTIRDPEYLTERFRDRLTFPVSLIIEPVPGSPSNPSPSIVFVGYRLSMATLRPILGKYLAEKPHKRPVIQQLIIDYLKLTYRRHHSHDPVIEFV